MELSRKAMAIADSVTLAIDAKAKAMAGEGIDVVGFGAGEPDFNTPQFICDAAKKAIDEGKTRYTPVSGTLGLREAICGKLARENGLAYEPGQIVVSNGAKHSPFKRCLTPATRSSSPRPTGFRIRSLSRSPTARRFLCRPAKKTASRCAWRRCAAR